MITSEQFDQLKKIYLKGGSFKSAYKKIFKKELRIESEEAFKKAYKNAFGKELKISLEKFASKAEVYEGQTLFYNEMVRTQDELRKDMIREIRKSQDELREELIREIKRSQEELREEFRTAMAELRNDIMTKMDAVLWEIKAMREEMAVFAYRQAKHSDKLESHDNRILLLEAGNNSPVINN